MLSKAEIDRIQALVDEISALRDTLIAEGLIQAGAGGAALPHPNIEVLATKTEAMIEAFTRAKAKLTGRSDLATIRAELRRSLLQDSSN